MLVLLKSAPDTSEAKRAVSLANDLGADIVLMQNAVYLAPALEKGSGAGQVYALDEDLRMRGLADEAVTRIDYDTLVDLMTGTDQVLGAF